MARLPSNKKNTVYTKNFYAIHFYRNSMFFTLMLTGIT
jgi:hypothetical protein